MPKPLITEFINVPEGTIFEVGHTYNFDGGQVYVNPLQTIVVRIGVQHDVDVRCPDCASTEKLIRASDRFFMLVQHNESCPWIRKLIADGPH